MVVPDEAVRGFMRAPEDDLAVLPNYIYRNVIPAVPDKSGWPISPIRIASGFIFLAAILDACRRKVAG